MNCCRALGAFLCLALPAFAAFDPAAFNAAVELYNQRKPLEAQTAFEALAAANPANADIQFYLGRLALQRDDYEKAVVYLEKTVALKPDDSRFHQRLGDAYGRAAEKASFLSQLGFAKKCQAEYERAVELDPKSTAARFSLMGFYQQAPSFAGGSMDRAFEQAREIKKLDAGMGRGALAGLYAKAKQYDLAFAEFAEALKLDPNDYGALFQTGRLAAVTGERLDEGLADLQRCLTMTPPADQPPLAAAHWRIGNILEKKNDKAGARAAYEAALKVDPNFTYASDALKRL